MVRARDSSRPRQIAGRPDPHDKDPGKVRAQGKLEAASSVLELTPSIRRKLKKPVGRLYLSSQLRSREFLSSLRNSPLVITVGDRVTETMQELGRTPDVQVVDAVERRVRRAVPDVAYVKLIRASNPAGTITTEAADAVQAAILGEKPARVLIHGEEDLLVLPALVAAQEGATIFYGQPGEGVVRVVVDERSRGSAQQILARMKRT